MENDHRWLRVPGDTLFAIGAILFVLFVVGLKLGYSLNPTGDSSVETPAKTAAAA